MNSEDLGFLPATQLAEMIRTKRLSPVETMRTLLDRISALEPKVNAFAYLAAAVSVVALIGGYAAAVLNSWRGGAMLAAVLALVYALLYGLVVSEQYSLLMGSIDQTMSPFSASRQASRPFGE